MPQTIPPQPVSHMSRPLLASCSSLVPASSVTPGDEPAPVSWLLFHVVNSQPTHGVPAEEEGTVKRDGRKLGVRGGDDHDSTALGTRFNIAGSVIGNTRAPAASCAIIRKSFGAQK